MKKREAKGQTVSELCTRIRAHTHIYTIQGPKKIDIKKKHGKKRGGSQKGINMGGGKPMR